MFRDNRSVNRQTDVLDAGPPDEPIARRAVGSATRAALIITLAGALTPGIAWAHVSEGAFVLLLPTEFYIWSGAWAVALTVAALVLSPPHWGEALFTGRRIARVQSPDYENTTSLLAFLMLVGLIFAGLTGSRDPLTNPLPLTVWTLFWMVFLILQGALGDFWRHLNPWTGPFHFLIGDRAPPLRLPDRIGRWPAVLGLLMVAGFAFADAAPDDPARLALVVAAYAAVTFLGMLLFGAKIWLARAECLTVLARLFADIAAIRWRANDLSVALPGWRLLERPQPSVSAGVFALVALGVGSFDGLNETFWWLDRIGVNPLEFPGRSAIVTETLVGLLAANLLLVGVFAAAVWLGLRLAAIGAPPATDHATPRFDALFAGLALAVAPIALAYHAAHYLTAILINMQYVAASATDPFGTGADYLDLGRFYVTTGFLNRLDTVETIFAAQAIAVVLGHVVSVMLAHSFAMRMFHDRRRASLSQIPLAMFMVAYTFLGLWLLASPKGA